MLPYGASVARLPRERAPPPVTMLRCSCRSLWRSARPSPRHAGTEAGGVTAPGGEAPVDAAAAPHSSDSPAADSRPPYVRPATCASHVHPSIHRSRLCGVRGKQLSVAACSQSLCTQSSRLFPASPALASAPPSSGSPGEATTATGRCSGSDPAWCAVLLFGWL